MKSNAMFLVKTKYDWADEMDVEGFFLMTPGEYDYFIKEVEAIEYPIEWYIGTNEFITFYEADDIFKEFDVQVLNLEQAELIKKLFVKYGEYGFTPLGALQGAAPQEWYDKNPSPKE